MRNQLCSTPLTPGFFLAVKTALLQIASGVRHLHSLRIVHRDLKPANVLLATSRRLAAGTNGKLDNDSPYEKFERGDYVAKISDMGLGKQLMGQSSFGLSTLNNTSLRGQSNGGESHVGGAGPGSVGWQAPEVMALRVSSEASARSDGSNLGQESFDASPADVPSSTRTSRSVDIFSLGCIFYSALIPGSHPFGEWYEREANIMRNRPVISALAQLSSDAYDLVVSMIHRDPRSRPTAKQICEHPFFWNAVKRLHFLCDLSDRLESDATNLVEGSEAASVVTTNLLAIERGASQIVGTAWDACLDADLLTNVQRFRTYDVSSVRDCLRLIRNKHHHYEELPTTVKARIGSNAEGLLIYFEDKFPRLVMHCYRFCCQFLAEDDPLVMKYSIISKPLGRSTAKLAESRQSSISGDTGISGTTSAALLPLLEQRVSNSTLDEACFELDPPSATSRDGFSAPCLNDCLNENKRDDASSPTEDAEEKCNEHPASFDADYCIVDAFDEQLQSTGANDEGIIIWEGSVASRSYGCRGWIRSDEEWSRRSDSSNRKADANLARCASDPKFRTRLCNHWDESLGTFCPMKKKNKCVFAHGPVELRIKDGKRNRWGKLVDKLGNSSNQNHSGGEDTYGAARSIESTRKVEGKWNTQKNHKMKK
jgi:serine/threonine-protein kinase/endoribonuclease IRE1